MQDTMETKEFFLKLVAASIADAPIPKLPTDVNFSMLAKLAYRNAVQSILYLALRGQRENVPTEIFTRLEKSYQAGLLREAAQQTQLHALRTAFGEAKIDFMLLKGSHLKSLYPSPEMRFMVDMDILVHEQDAERAQKIILSRGFHTEFDNGKDLVLIKKPFLTIELHRSLFQPDYALYPYFTAVWDRVEQASEREFKMPPNDLYVYTLAHLAEHYTAAGSCFRPVMDLFLMEQRWGGRLDFFYIEAQFQSLGIAEFAENIRALGKAMFLGGEKSDTLRMMENYVVLGPPVQNAAAAAEAAHTKESKGKRMYKAAFPPYRHMALRYPTLKKLPFLLPVFWLWRLVQYAFTKDAHIAQKREALKNVDQKSSDVLAEIFRRSGL